MKAAARYFGISADREIVHRAVDRQLADVSAGEKKRPHHEGIGGEGDPRTDFHSRLVFQGGEDVVIESRQKDALDEFGGKPTAAAVSEKHLLVPRFRHRA